MFVPVPAAEAAPFEPRPLAAAAVFRPAAWLAEPEPEPLPEPAAEPEPATDTVAATPDPLALAHAERADALAHARADGFAAGLDSGRAAAEAALGARLDELARLAAALAAATAVDPAALAPLVADAVRAVVIGLLDAEPELAAFNIEARARAAVDGLAPGGRVTLWLAPADADAVAPALAGPAVEIARDPALPRGAVRVVAGPARIDDGALARLDRLAPELVRIALDAVAA